MAIPVETPETFGARLKRLFQAHRRRLATLALVVFLAAVANAVYSALPRETHVRLPLEDHAALTEVRVEYLYEGRAFHEVVYHYAPGEAPAALHHTIDLSHGDYVVRLFLTDESGAQRMLQGRLTAPADGEIRVRLERP